MPDFISQLVSGAPLTGLHDGLIALYDALLADETISAADKEIIARLRAQTDIALKGL